MIYFNKIARSPRRGARLSAGLGRSCVVACALGLAAWVTDIAPPLHWIFSAGFSEATPSVVALRFPDDAAPNLLAADSPLRHHVWSVSFEIAGLQQAKDLLAQKLRSTSWQTASLGDFSAPTLSAPIVPVPLARPVEASLDVERSSPDETEPRTLLQKLSDLIPSGLASLSPDGGPLGDPPGLQSLGSDKLTAVYDISARAVYMPNGLKLEAHSGFGKLKDDPRHVSRRNVGATPPAIYDLKLRERKFHGVAAVRMTPVGKYASFGRTGLLVHSYLLGPDGDSNGCVSIKDYEKFLAAFQSGNLKRLVVVGNLNDLSSVAFLKS